jgi:His Kinase A (phospho-acceptor) domain
MASLVRRYRFGVLGVALLGVVTIGVWVLWSWTQIASEINSSLRLRARHAADAYRKKLAQAVEKFTLGYRKPLSPETWTQADPALEEAFESTPDLLGIVVLTPAGSEAALIGPTELRRLERLAPPANGDEMAIRLDPGTDPPRVTVAFLVANRRDLPPDPATAPIANLHLQFASFGSLEQAIFEKFQFGVVIVVIIFYLLAVLGYFIGRHGERANAREREGAVRLKAIGEVAGAIAHELRNPLNAISLSFQVIGESLRTAGPLEGSRAGDLDRARGEVQKISKVVDNFVSFARLSALDMTEVDLAALAREVFSGLAAPAAEASVKAELHVEGPTGLRGDREKLRDVLATTATAVLDAVKSAPGTFDLDLAGTRKDVTITIRGRSARVDSRRLSNFASTRRAWDEPVGLALTIARTWIECHGGSVKGFEPTEGRAEIVIVLPKGIA